MKDEPLMQADLARIVHDLRAPLMPLRTAAWLLRNEPAGSERVRELADIVDRQSARLARMVEELGDWGRGAGEAQTPDRDGVDAGMALDMAIAGLPNCTIEPHYDGEAASARIRADPNQLEQLLHTLIAHALHRAGDGAPDVDVALLEGQLRIRVHDHGAPLEPCERDALLSRPQAHPFDEGLGLRLLLAGRIAESHGGRLWVEDTGSDGLALVCVLPSGS